MKLFIIFTIIMLVLTGCIKKEHIVYKPSHDKKIVHQIAEKKPVVYDTEQSMINEQKKVQEKTKTAIPAPIMSDSTTLNFPTLNGNIIRVNASGFNMEFLSPKYRNKNVLIFMFGYDCPHCLKEMPIIRRLQNNPNLKIIGIHAKSMIGDKRLKNFVASKGLNFDILSFKNDIKMIRFLKNAGYFDDEVPTSILVHKDGTMENVYPETVLDKL